jgi:hypothetical protein
LRPNTAFSSRIMTLKMIGNVLRRCGCRLR